MDKDFGICGRDKEIKGVYKFINDRVNEKKSGILYIAGPPGTGKSMSVASVMDQIKNVSYLKLNCFKAQSSKHVLSRICESVGLNRFIKSNESEMIAQLSKKFSGRSCEPFLIVLDEMDQLPKSSNFNLFKTIFSWTNQKFSKLLIIGIANTVNLTSRYQTVASFVGEEFDNIEKIVFRPYTSKDIRAILNWYLENDENYEDASVDPKALIIISSKIARENGDIRSALNALKTVIEDTVQKEIEEKNKRDNDQYPTPPATPPPLPCKEKTNLSSVVHSIKKRRERESHYFDDQALSVDQIILVCLYKLCSSSKNGATDMKTFSGKASDVLHKYGIEAAPMNARIALEQLESQGLVVLKKSSSRMLPDKIILKASEREISEIAKNKDMILEFIGRL